MDGEKNIKEKKVLTQREEKKLTKKYSFLNSNNQNENLKSKKIKSANTSKSKSKNKSKSKTKNNIKGYLYAHILQKNINSQLNLSKKNKSNEKNNINKKSSFNVYNSIEHSKIEYKKISKTANQTKNNSRTNSNEKMISTAKNSKNNSKNKNKNNNNNNNNNKYPIKSGNDLKNFFASNQKNSISKSITSSVTSLIKTKNKNASNSCNILHNAKNNFHIKGLSEIPLTKNILNFANNSKLLKSSHFTSNTKKYIKMNDIKYIEYITSNLKNTNSTKNTSSISNRSMKKKEEIERDYLHTKLNNKYKNIKNVTSVQSKQNSKSNSRIDESYNNIITNKNSKIINLVHNNKPFTANPSPSQKGVKHILKNNFSKKEITTKKPLKKNYSIHNALIEKMKKQKNSNNTSNNNSKINNSHQIFNNYIINENVNLHDNNLNHSNIKENTIKKINKKENTNKELEEIPQMTVETISISIQSTIRDNIFYRKEMEKISNIIKQCKNIFYKYLFIDHYKNEKYPKSQLNFYKYGRLLGKGAFGKVNLALHICSGRLVAIKSFNKSKLKKKHDRKKIKHEIDILSRLRSPFVSQILDYFETETHILIVMEYICGDLLNYIRKRTKLPEQITKIIFKQIIEGLDYIHKNNIVHRDIKLDNILIDLTNTIKICDFGVSRRLLPGDVMHEHCGTPAYIAPEIFKDNGYEGYECDIWSAGVTLYFMLGGVQPFKGDNIKELKKNIISGKYCQLDNVSNEANNLIDGMLQIDPKKRLTISQILNHPWLFNVNVNNRFNINLFTNAEKLLLNKYNIDYLNNTKDDLVEIFSDKNLDTLEDDKKQIGNTKSLILAPYNSFANSNDILCNKNILVENNICKFRGKAQHANLKYELNNNNDFDNGVIKTQHSNNNDYDSNNDFSSGNVSFSKQISPNVELNDEIVAEKKSNLNSSKNKSSNKETVSYINIDPRNKIMINEEIVKDIENLIGYNRKYLINCLLKNEINYATATYYLLEKGNLD